MPPPLRFATFLAPNIRPVYQGVVAAVAEKLGVHAELVVGTSFDQFRSGEIDAGFVCGLPYVNLARGDPSPIVPVAAPVLAGARYGGRPIYFSDVIVHRESEIRSFGDLRGRSWAYNDPDSHSGYHLTRFHLARMGGARGYFGHVVEAGFHQKAIRMVASMEVDAAAIDSQVLAVELRDQPELADVVHVVATFGPSTIQPLVVAAHVPGTLVASIRDAVLTMHESRAGREALAAGLVDRFVPVMDADYDDIRRMLAVADDAGVELLGSQRL